MVIACFGTLLAAAPATAAPPAGFTESQAFSGLTEPTVVRFAPDGRVFIAEKSGLIKVFDNLSDPTPSTFADLRTNVYNFWDRGLLGMTLDPDFEDNGFVYVNYAHDAEIGDTAPKYGTPGVTADPCPTPPGPNADGCVISGRISRLDSSANESVLIEDYCQQYPSHSSGSLEFDGTGALWASGGEGASFTFADYGQDGDPVNPCGDPDPSTDVGDPQTPPSAEGGALRSQDLRTDGDPVSLDGTLIRIDGATGDGVPSNPLAGDDDPNAERIVAHGLRNPFRFTISPDDEVYVGDVGWTTWEEINRFPVETGDLQNFGWPCFEGNNSGTSAHQSAPSGGYDALDLTICEDLYAASDEVEAPLFAYNHGSALGAGCESGSSAIAGLEFYTAGAFPAAYDDALFFADHNRDCIWVMTAGPDGKPNPATVTPFQSTALNPVSLEVGPAGALFYTNFDTGTIQRIAFTGTPSPPSVSSDGTTVTYTGSTGINTVTVTENPGGSGGTDYQFAETGISAGTGCTDNGNTATCPKAAPTSVVMNLGAGDDVVDATSVSEDAFTINGQAGGDTLRGSAVGDTVNGGDGNDPFVAGQGGSDTVNGGDGNDGFGAFSNRLFGGSGNDTVNGGAGNDRLEGFTGNDTLDGGTGIDRALYGAEAVADCAAGDGINVSLDNVMNDNGCQGEAANSENVMNTIESVTGSRSGDTITGDCDANTFAGEIEVSEGSAGAGDVINGDPAGGCNPGSPDFMGGGEGGDTFNGDGTVNGTTLLNGIDTVTYGTPYSGHTSGINITLDEGQAANDADGFGNSDQVHGDIDRIIGTGSGDTINATTAADQAVQFFGRLGTDVLTDGPFDDLLDGQGGTDTANCVNGGTDTARSAETNNGCELNL